MNIHAGTIQATDRAEVLGTDPVPAKYYYDPEWYALELEAIWKRSWLNLGHVCELPEPGSFIRRELEFAKASLLIVRGKDGAIRAFHNVCTHRGTQLVGEACGKKNTFSCPYHMWTYGTDGGLISAPDFERFYIEKEDVRLKEVAADVCGGLIFVCLDPRQSLAEFLGPMAARLEENATARATTFHEYVYDIAANWKMTYDNFQENYHLKFIHPRTSASATEGDYPFGYPTTWTLTGRHRFQTLPPSKPELLAPSTIAAGMRSYARLMADGMLELPNPQDYNALFPNVFMLCNPGSNFLHYVLPLGPEKSRGVIRIYWNGEDETASVRYAREAAMGGVRDVHSEDFDVIERGQRGLSSGALEHIHFQEMEVLCRHLIEVVVEDVEAWRAGQSA